MKIIFCILLSRIRISFSSAFEVTRIPLAETYGDRYAGSWCSEQEYCLCGAGTTFFSLASGEILCQKPPLTLENAGAYYSFPWSWLDTISSFPAMYRTKLIQCLAFCNDCNWTTWSYSYACTWYALCRRCLFNSYSSRLCFVSGKRGVILAAIICQLNNIPEGVT